MSNEFKAKNGIILGTSHPVNFILNSSSFTQDQSTLLTAYAISNYMGANLNPVINKVNVIDTSLSTLTSRYNFTEASLSTLTQTIVYTDSSVSTLYYKFGILDNSVGLLTTKVNIIDSSLNKLRIYTDGSLATRDASISYLYINKLNEASINNLVPYTGATSDISLGAHKITLDSIQFNPSPNNVFKEGLLFFDNVNKTLAVDLDTDVTLQIGQENHIISYNDSSTTIPNGTAVYINGTFNSYPTIRPAIANNTSTAKVVGVTTHDITPSTLGYVTSTGVVHDISTNLWPNNTILYLSDASAGKFTSIAPHSPSYTTAVATVIVSSATVGSIFVNIQTGQSLSDLSDVKLVSPLIDQVLKYDGVSWINGPSTTSSAGNGITFYMSDISIRVVSAGNVNPVNTLTHYPYDASTIIDSTIANNNIVFIESYLNNPLGGSQIDAGQWTFYTYCAASDTTGISEIIHSIRRVRSDALINITTTGSGTTRTATASSGSPFSVSNIDTGGSISTDSYIETSTGLYRISSRISDTQVVIICPATYVNESNSTLEVWKEVFQVSTGEINTTSIALVETATVKPAYSILASDKLADILFAKTDRTSNTTISYAHQGTTQASRFITPLVVRHNDLSGLQGGNTTQRNHISDAELAVLQATSGINTGNQDLSPYATILNVNSSLNVITTHLNTTDSSVLTLTTRHNITESSLGILTTKYNVTDTSVGSLWYAIDNTNAMTGFLDGNNITVAYDWTNRNITLTGDLRYLWKGKLRTLTSPWTSTSHTATPGSWFLSSTDGSTYTWSQIGWPFEDVMVSYIHYDTSSNLSWAIRETHGTMDYKSHEEFHSQVGTYRVSGGQATVGTYVENSAVNSATSPGFDAAVIKDEDLLSVVPAWSDTVYTTMHIGPSNAAVFDTSSTTPFTATTDTFIQVNNITTGVMAAGINARWYNVYQIIMPTAASVQSQKYRMIMLQPQTTFTSLAAAQAEDVRSISLGNLSTLSTEFVVYARITYVTSNADNNNGKCRIATGGITYNIGNRAGQVSISGVTVNDHASLSNLTWLNSGHIGSPNTVPYFNGIGIASERSDLVPYTGATSNLNLGNFTINASSITLTKGATNNYILTSDAIGNAYWGVRDAGPQGPQGYQGSQGTQGSQGFQGYNGTNGTQGFQGATGATGAQGPQGFQGYNGTNGTQGPQGFQGTQGFQGYNGTQGPQGFQGTQGPQGFQGYNGTNGAQGPQGAQGALGSVGLTINPITFNNIGSGSASGITFDGSIARTISHNTLGAVPYIGATTNVNLGANNLIIDTNSLFVDSINHRVGIGTTTPLGVLDVSGAVTINGASANNGILNVKQTGSTNSSGFILLNSNESASARWYIDSSNIQRIDNGSTGSGNICLNGVGVGKVGIGITSPTTTLDVGGQGKFVSSIFPVLQITRTVSSGGGYVWGGQVLTLNQTDNTAGGIGTYYKANNSIGTSAYAGLFGGGLQTATSGNEIGFIGFKAAYQNHDPANGYYGLKLVATSDNTDDVILAGNVTIGSTNTPTKKLEIIDGTDTIKIGKYNDGGYASIWFNQTAPNNSNYGFLGNSTDTYLNGTNQVVLSINDSEKVKVTSTGAAVTGDISANNLVISGGDVKSSANNITLYDNTSNPVFRGVRANSFSDAVSTRFFQVGNSNDNVSFTTLGGSSANRMMFSSSATQITSGFYGSTKVPTGIFEVTDGTNSFLNVLTNGNVGVNTQTPSAKLQVDGSIKSESIYVKEFIITDSAGVPKFKMSYDTATDALITTKI